MKTGKTVVYAVLLVAIVSMACALADVREVLVALLLGLALHLLITMSN